MARRLRPMLFLLHLLLPLFAWSQQGDDTTSSAYDSIQDLQVRRLEQRVGRQLEEARQRYEVSVRRADSITERLEGISEGMDRLEKEHRSLVEQVTILKEKLQNATDESAGYRSALHRTLWITGIAGTLLVATALVALFLFALKTRNLLARVRERQGKFRRNLRKLRKEIPSPRSMEKRTLRKVVRRELRRKKRIR